MERVPPRVITAYKAYMSHARKQEREVRYRKLYPERKTFSVFIAKRPGASRNRPRGGSR